MARNNDADAPTVCRLGAPNQVWAGAWPLGLRALAVCGAAPSTSASLSLPSCEASCETLPLTQEEPSRGLSLRQQTWFLQRRSRPQNHGLGYAHDASHCTWFLSLFRML